MCHTQNTVCPRHSLFNLCLIHTVKSDSTVNSTQASPSTPANSKAVEQSMSVGPSMWDAMSSCLTPMTLFLVLNFTIVTIFLTSKLSSQKQPPSPPTHRLNKTDTETHDQSELHRSPSVLQSLKSLNFYQYASQEHAAPAHDDVVMTQHASFGYEPVQQPQEMLEMDELDTSSYQPREDDYKAEVRFENEEKDEANVDRSLDEVYSQLNRASHSHHRTKSDMEPASGAVAIKLAKKMQKSASSKSAFPHFNEAEILEARRPATVKELKPKTVDPEDEEVDSKADDFINMVKQQQKLQRLDSILRYKEMLGRGAAK